MLRPFAVFDVELSPAQGDVQSGGPGGRGAGGPGGVPQQGVHQYAQALLDELDFPEELVLNREPAAFLAHLERRLSRT